jgi:hypothetical protein
MLGARLGSIVMAPQTIEDAAIPALCRKLPPDAFHHLFGIALIRRFSGDRQKLLKASEPEDGSGGGLFGAQSG